VKFDEVTFDLLSSFEKHLKSKELNANTIKKMFSYIRKYVNLAIDKEHIELNKYPFRKFKVKSVQSNREFLTPEELERIEGIRLNSSQEYLQLALDKFLFAVYTGLRYSDVSALTTDNLIVNDENEWIVLEMKKVKEQIRIPVYLLFDGKALDIFYKYAGPEKVIFPHQSNQLLNSHIASLAKIAEISKRVTFHVARHTTATILLYKGVNITTVQKLLGHKRLETTMIYGKVMDITMVKELQNISFSR
jgi:site-specific recombinase XerD